MTAETDKFMWEILVPTIRNNPGTRKRPWFSLRHHKVWDQRVRSVSGGLTVLKPAKGQWVSPEGTLFAEKMIPVRVIATEREMDGIADFTAKHYEQEAVLYYRVSDCVRLRNYPENKGK